MNEYTSTLESIGLAKNEARIYETLVREGEIGVGKIASVSKVHRRNVYDSLNRLIERGLVFERMTSTEHLYQATDPKKLLEIVEEKRAYVSKALPDLEKLYLAKEHEDDVIVYRGIEGWKSYLRDIIRIGVDVYTIGAKGLWQDDRFSHVMAQLSRESKRKGMRMHWLIDADSPQEYMNFLEEKFNVEYRMLPKGSESTVAIDVFGDHVVILSGITSDSLVEDRSVIVLINPDTANAFRTWFKLLWGASDPESGRTKKYPKPKLV